MHDMWGKAVDFFTGILRRDQRRYTIEPRKDWAILIVVFLFCTVSIISVNMYLFLSFGGSQGGGDDFSLPDKINKLEGQKLQELLGHFEVRQADRESVITNGAGVSTIVRPAIQKSNSDAI
jgi:hypothetical protein